MSWFKILKVSTEDAIYDAKRFAPEMIAEQKKIDKEVKQKALQLANQASKEKYYVERSQLPNFEYYYGNKNRRSKLFFMTYNQYFLTGSELEKYKKIKNRRVLLMRKQTKLHDEDGYPYGKPLETSSNSKIKEMEREARELQDEEKELVAAAAWRWNYFIKAPYDYAEENEGAWP